MRASPQVRKLRDDEVARLWKAIELPGRVPTFGDISRFFLHHHLPCDRIRTQAWQEAGDRYSAAPLWGRIHTGSGFTLLHKTPSPTPPSESMDLLPLSLILGEDGVSGLLFDPWPIISQASGQGRGHWLLPLLTAYHEGQDEYNKARLLGVQSGRGRRFAKARSVLGDAAAIATARLATTDQVLVDGQTFQAGVRSANALPLQLWVNNAKVSTNPEGQARLRAAGARNLTRLIGTLDSSTAAIPILMADPQRLANVGALMYLISGFNFCAQRKGDRLFLPLRRFAEMLYPDARDIQPSHLQATVDALLTLDTVFVQRGNSMVKAVLHLDEYPTPRGDAWKVSRDAPSGDSDASPVFWMPPKWHTEKRQGWFLFEPELLTRTRSGRARALRILIWHALGLCRAYEPDEAGAWKVTLDEIMATLAAAAPPGQVGWNMRRELSRMLDEAAADGVCTLQRAGDRRAPLLIEPSEAAREAWNLLKARQQKPEEI